MKYGVPQGVSGRGEFRVNLLRRLAECFADDIAGLNFGPEESRGHNRDLLRLFGECAAARHRGGSPYAQQIGCVTGFARTTNEHRNVRPLASTVGMQFVEHKKFQPFCRLYDLAIEGACQQQFEHHVVGEQDVRGIAGDFVPACQVVLSGIAIEPNWFFSLRVTDSEKLFEFTVLAVAECVHGVDDNGLNSLSAAVAKHAVDDRNDIGQAFSRARSGGQDVILATVGGLNCGDLMSMQTHG